ncbi:hypothetical protein EC991_009977 [Linnemannia zychae]|nr:hypothetical protein EC991_009977 [Linnemannia zychae]
MQHYLWECVIRYLHESDEMHRPTAPLFKQVTVADCQMACERLGRYKCPVGSSLPEAALPRPVATCRAPSSSSRLLASPPNLSLLHEKNSRYTSHSSGHKLPLSSAQPRVDSVDSLPLESESLKKASTASTPGRQQQRKRGLPLDDLPIDEQLSHLKLKTTETTATAATSSKSTSTQVKIERERRYGLVPPPLPNHSTHSIMMERSLIDLHLFNCHFWVSRLEQQAQDTLLHLAFINKIDPLNTRHSNQELQSHEESLISFLERYREVDSERRRWLDVYMARDEQYQLQDTSYTRIETYEGWQQVQKEREQFQKERQQNQEKERQRMQKERQQVRQKEREQMQKVRQQIRQKERQQMEKERQQHRQQTIENDAIIAQQRKWAEDKKKLQQMAEEEGMRKRARRDDIHVKREILGEVDSETSKSLTSSLSAGDTVAEVAQDMQRKLQIDSTSISQLGKNAQPM